MPTNPKRQLATIRQWLEQRGYSYISGETRLTMNRMQPGTFAFRLNIPILLQGGTKQINIPIDVVVMPLQSCPGELPLLIEACIGWGLYQSQ